MLRHLDDMPPVTMQDIVVRGRAGMARVKAGTRDALIGRLDACDAVRDAKQWQGPDGEYLTTEAWLTLCADQIGVENANTVREMYRASAKRGHILALADAADIQAAGRGKVAKYDWRKLWRIVEPPEKRKPRAPDALDPATPAIAAELAAKLRAAEAEAAQAADREFELIGRAERAEQWIKEHRDVERLADTIGELREKIPGYEAQPDTPAGGRIAELEAELAAARKRIGELEAELEAMPASPYDDDATPATIPTAPAPMQQTASASDDMANWKSPLTDEQRAALRQDIEILLAKMAKDTARRRAAPDYIPPRRKPRPLTAEALQRVRDLAEKSRQGLVSAPLKLYDAPPWEDSD